MKKDFFQIPPNAFTMKIPFLTTALIISSFAILAQEAKVTTDKEKYKYDETIKVTFEIDAKYDSSAVPAFSGFKVTAGPTRTSTMSMINGKKTVLEATKYILQALESGQLSIGSPTYYIDGLAIAGNAAHVEVDASTLTQKDLEAIKVQSFVEEGIKPQGTVRHTFHKDKGYVEIYGEMGWQFHRLLTLAEIEQLKKLE